MKTKKTFKIIGIILGAIVITFLCLSAYGYYLANTKFKPSKNQFTKRVAYIDFKKAKLTEGFEMCDSTTIVDYYNYRRGDKVYNRTEYSKGKNGLRNYVLSKYQNKNYSDSGYLNFRFVVNCKGEAGAYIIHQNNLDLEPKQFNKSLINQLFEITSSLKEWRPNYMAGGHRDSYMYISYRIENGEITEILP